MSLSDLASLGSFVSGLAVLASLVFFYFQLRQIHVQVRQAEKNQRAIIHQGRTAQTTDRLLRMAEPAFASTYLKVTLGRAPLADEIEFRQFTMMMTVRFREMQDAFFQHDIGLLDEAGLNNHLGVFQGVLLAPAARAVWHMVKPAYDLHFVERVDAIVEKSRPEQQSDTAGLERFKAELARITAGTGG
jgi:hypothetical protein